MEPIRGTGVKRGPATLGGSALSPALVPSPVWPWRQVGKRDEVEMLMAGKARKGMSPSLQRRRRAQCWAGGCGTGWVLARMGA